MTALFVIVMGLVRLGDPDPQLPKPPADFNSSASVDLADLAIFYNGFGAGIGNPLVPAIPYRAADLDADGDIDWGDLALFNAATTGPQPGTRPCLTNNDCDDNDPCTGEMCTPSFECAYEDHPGCCHNDFYCNDYDPCTSVCRQGPNLFPTCQSPIRSCCFFDFHCNDGSDCTGDTCDPANQCNSEPIVPCCGNGEVEAGEECDDGNSTPGDGCDDVCQFEGPDDCQSADPIADGTTAFSNLGMTSDGPGACGGVGSDLWYEYTAPCDGIISIDTFGSEFNTILAAYDGCACADAPASDCCHPHFSVGCEESTCQAMVCLSDSFCCEFYWDGFCVMGAAAICGDLCTAWPEPLIACDDTPGDGESFISFGAVAGNCYKLQVGGFSGDEGSGVIHVVSCCGNGTCDSGEDGYSCPSDCGCAALAACGGEAVACYCDCICIEYGDCCADAATACDLSPSGCCGDGFCSLEDSCSCPADCGEFCGDACCNGLEDSCSCPEDCGGACCGNNVIEGGEECDDGNTDPGDGCDEFCQDECFDLQDLCTFDDDCCDSNAVCDPTPSCNVAGFSTRCCLPMGTSCGQDCDCCGEGHCESGSCCSPLGASCFSNFECCFGSDVRCDSGTCCGPVGTFCTFDSECCGDGRCEDSTCCSSLGEECKSNFDCCDSNLRCDKGVCEGTR